jgi:FAD/FMN-containing dehydrogenase
VSLFFDLFSHHQISMVDPNQVSWGEKIFATGTSEYAESTGSYFSASENELSPALVARPECVEDVISVVLKAKEYGIPLAIRGGGHTPWAGAANIDSGITMDLRNIKGVELIRNGQVLSVGAGERWENVYQALLHTDLAVAGGRISKVGVGGLILGGPSCLSHTHPYHSISIH